MDSHEATSDHLTGVVGPPITAQLPPHLRLLLLTDGKRISQAVHVLAELNVADELVDGPRSVAELAKATNSNPDALVRVLRVAAAFGVFAEEPEGSGCFTLTPMAEALCSNSPESVRDLVLFNGDDLLWHSYGELAYTVRTGKPAFDRIYGRSFFAHLRQEPEAGRLFDRAMTQMSQVTGSLMLGGYDFSRYSTIVDVGGGNGQFLVDVLTENPGVRGVLVDQPEVVAGADRRFAAAGLDDRVEVVAGDFFSHLPAGHDAYVLKAVLHDWQDRDAVRILRTVRAAMTAPHARLLICEFLVGHTNCWDRGKLLDLDMLVRFGGRERNLAEWRTLLAEGGFELVNDPVPGRWSVLECRPAGSVPGPGCGPVSG